MNVSGNFVDTESTRYIATLVRLFPQFLRPTFINTLTYLIRTLHSKRVHGRENTDLSNRFGIIEAPASVDV